MFSLVKFMAASTLRFVTFVVLLSISGCDNLTVLVPSRFQSTSNVTIIPSLNEEGHFQLKLQGASPKQNYEVYGIEASTLPDGVDPSALQNTVGALSTLTLSPTEASEKTEATAYLASGSKLADVTGEGPYIWDHDLTNHNVYVFFLKSKTDTWTHVVTQINLQDVQSVTGQVNSQDLKLVLSWSEVPGATAYEMLEADVTKGSSTTNSYTLDPYDDTRDYSLCVKASLGSLKSDHCAAYTIKATATRTKAISVTSSTPDGFYKSGATISLQVQFSDVVKVLSDGSPALVLQFDGTQANAEYISGSETTTLSFGFTVQDGFDAAKLDAIKLIDLDNSASIVDGTGMAVSRVLPLSGSGKSLAEQSALTIDTTSPTSPGAPSFSSSTLATLNFPVTWTNSTDLHFDKHELMLCSSANCSTGCSASVFSSSSPLNMTGVNGSSYFACVRGLDLAGNASAWVPSLLPATVDTAAAQVINVTSSTADGSYKAGDSIIVTVQFSDTVNVTNSLDLGLLLATGSTQRQATYLSGSGTDTLAFQYIVQPGDAANDLNYASVSALTQGATGTIKNTLGTAASLTLPALTSAGSLATQKAIIIDTTAPTAPGSVGFSATTSSSASFPMSWSSSTDAHFQTYELKLCAANDCASSCIGLTTSATSPFSMTGVDGTSYYGCVRGKDVAGNYSTWTASLAPIKVDTTGPTITNMSSSTANGYYKVGDVIDLDVTFSEPVFVTNSSQLSILMETGATDRTASYVSGSGTSTLSFHYTVQSGDTTADLEANAAALISLGASGTIKDAAGNASNLALPTGGNANSLSGQKEIVIDTTNPTAPSAIVLPGTTSNALSLTISWTDSTDTNFKQQNLKLCPSAGCSGTCVGALSKTLSPALLSGSSGGTYYACVQGEDLAGNTSAWVSSAGTITLDTTAPSVTDVNTSLANGSYKVGASVPIDISFSEAVYVTDSSGLTLSLETGATDRTATYVSGSGTTILHFLYTVQAGDTASPLEANSSSALVLAASSTLRDAAGNDAALTLPSLAGAASLSGHKSIVIDTTAPTPPSNVGWSTSVTGGLTGSLGFTLGSDSALKQHNLKMCTSFDCVTGCTGLTTSTTSPKTLTGSTNTTYYGCAQAEDLAGNTSDWVPSLTTLTLDQTGPLVVNVSSPMNDGVYTAGTPLSVSVKFNENITVADTAQLGLSLNLGTARLATYLSGNGTDTLVFSYTPVAADSTTDLEVSSTSALTKGTTTVRDLYGNDANLTLTALGGATSLAGQKAIEVDNTPPTAPSAVSFATPDSVDLSFPISWTNSTDAHFSTHSVKLCAVNTCDSGCTSAISSVASPAVVTGVKGSTYYGCVQGVDGVGLTSAWVSSTSTMKVFDDPVFAGVASAQVLGSWDDGNGKVELTLGGVPSGPITQYDIFFSTSATLASFNLSSPAATINVGDTVYDANPNDSKILAKIPYTTLADGYYLVRYRGLPGVVADTNTAISSVTYVLKGQPNYVLVPRKFSNLAYDYFIMKYEASASVGGSFDTNDRITTDETNLAECNYQFHVNGVAFHSSCGTNLGTKTLLSTPNVVPAGGLHFHQAFASCRNSTTTDALIRLPTVEEWKRAARWVGTDYSAMETVFENGSGANCNLSAALIATGSRANCKSTLGLFDVAGNGTEFTDNRYAQYAPSTRFSYSPVLGKSIRNGIENTSSVITDRNPSSDPLTHIMGAFSNNFVANTFGTAELGPAYSTQPLPVAAARCVGFRKSQAPTPTQLALPSEPQYTAADYSGAASSWTIPENKFAGENKPETLTITVTNPGDTVAEGTISLAWSPWQKTVCGSGGSCTSSDNGMTYSVYRFEEPNRVSLRYDVPWALGTAGSVYASDKPIDPLAVDSSFNPLYTSATTDGRLIATITNCDASNTANCSFVDGVAANTGFSARKIYDYILVVKDPAGNSVYPIVRRNRSAFFYGTFATLGSYSTRPEPRFRRASVFLVDENYQAAQTIPQVMVHVPMDKSGLTYDYFIYKYKAAAYSGTITNDSTTAYYPKQQTSGSWVQNAGLCEHLFLKTGTFDVTACGDGSLLNPTTTIFKSVSGTTPQSTINQGSFWKACRNSKVTNEDGKDYSLRLTTDTQWFKAADWGDVNQDGTIDQNSTTGAVSVETIESGATNNCNSDNRNSSAPFNNGSSQTINCRSRYGAADMVGNIYEWTDALVSSSVFMDDGVDGNLFGKIPYGSNVVPPTSAVMDLLNGIATSAGAGSTINAANLYMYSSGGDRAGIRGGGWSGGVANGRTELMLAVLPDYAGPDLSGRCSFSQ